MKVILLQDIKNLGKKDDVKEVADGYARNFLLPNKLVKSITDKSLADLEKEKKRLTQKAEEELKAVQELVSRVDGQEIEIFAKVKDDGNIYGSITPLKISQALKNNAFNVKKTQVNFKEPIKKTGEYPVIINFDHGLEAEIKVIITEEKKEEKEEEES